MERIEEEIEVRYYLVDPGSEHDIPSEILPEGTYFFLRRSDETLLHYIIGILDDEQKILYVNLTDGRSHLWRDETNFDSLEDRIYSVPVKIRTTSTIMEVAVEYFPYPQGLLNLNL